MGKQKSQITILHDRKKESVVHPVTGVFGGFNGAGLLVAHFHFDYATIPNMTDVTVVDGRGTNEVKNISRGDLTRDYVSSVTMPREVALAIGQWFTKMGEEGIKK